MDSELELMRQIADRLSQHSQRQDPPEQFLDRAALVGNFDLEQLYAGASPAEGRFLASSCSVVEQEGKSAWQLRSDLRQARLQSLLTSREQLQKALSDVRRIGYSAASADTLTAALHDVLSGDRVALDVKSREELAAYRTVASWLRSADSTEIDDFQRQIEVQEVLEPFRFLVAYDGHTGKDAFVGRDDELKVLRTFVSAQHSAGMLRSARRVAQRVLGSVDDLLVVSGTGGVGKSTLLAKFILQLVASNSSSATVPFAYLDLDRSTLSAIQPATLLLEASRQFEWQLPDQAAALRTLRMDTRDAINTARSVKAPTSKLSSNEEDDENFDETLDPELLDERDLRLYLMRFASILSNAARTSPLILLIIDTFEEAQLQGDDAVARIEQFIEIARAQAHGPTLRIILSGRDEIGDRFAGATRVTLKEFQDTNSKALFLERRGVAREVAESVASSLNGKPLTLLLASTLIKEEGREAVSVSFTTALLDKIRKNLIDGILYKRILEHIEDEEVRRLVHPGLVLRRIDADVVEKVLVPALGLKLDATRIARTLHALRRQKDLIAIDDDGSIRHRQDVRGQMLELMIEEDRKTVDQLHRHALDYYLARQKDPANWKTRMRDRAEELYHQLSLGTDLETVADRWTQKARPALAMALDELTSDAAQVTLKILLGRTLKVGEPDRVPPKIQAEYVRRLAIRQIKSEVDPVAAVRTLNQATSSMGKFEAQELELRALAHDRAGLWRPAAEHFRRILEPFIDSAVQPLRGATRIQRLNMLLDFAERNPDFMPTQIDALVSNVMHEIESANRLKNAGLNAIALAGQRLLALQLAPRLRTLLPFHGEEMFLDSNFSQVPTNEDRWVLALTRRPEQNGPLFIDRLHWSQALQNQLTFLTTSLDQVGTRTSFAESIRDCCQILFRATRGKARVDYGGVSAEALGFLIRHLLRPVTPNWYVPMAAQLLIMTSGRIYGRHLLEPDGTLEFSVGVIDRDRVYSTTKALSQLFSELDQIGMLDHTIQRYVRFGGMTPIPEFAHLLKQRHIWRRGLFGELDERLKRLLWPNG